MATAWRPVDPTRGFKLLPLNRSNLVIQRPYDLPEDHRCSFCDGVHRLWVLYTDKPHTPTSRTSPRTEIRIQVFGTSPHATDLMLRVYNGSLYYYRETLWVQNIYNRWFKLNVIHDVDASKVKVYIDASRSGMLLNFTFCNNVQETNTGLIGLQWYVTPHFEIPTFK
ncbi:hypothetical protein CRG98_030936 [Punica granatum]|uniref:Alginate lyase 2 domain-containing protein n=1 Tax=Punica granatum TaxID=22663 RepID=A0A2I0IZ16_PUNGR|nr:hypothetical protein CRG98_030936 [Punica granatum]